MIRCRLDCALENEHWHTLFPCSYTEYLEMVGSDNRPLVAYLKDKVPRRRGQFRFDKRWIGLEGLMESITIGWTKYNGGCTEDIVTKISNCHHKLLNSEKIIHHMGRTKLMIFKNPRKGTNRQ